MLPEINEENFKFALSTDLTMFILEIWTRGQTEQSETIKLLLDTWSKRVEENANIMKRTLAAQLVENSNDPEMTLDVALVMMDVHNTDTKIWKKEFQEGLLDMLMKRLNLLNI